MAVYRLTANIILTEEDEAKGLYQYLEQVSHRFLVIKRGEPQEERSSLQLEHCYHDETPVRPCEVLQRWESS